jgi:outer membrane protein assembly factor BamB
LGFRDGEIQFYSAHGKVLWKSTIAGSVSGLKIIESGKKVAVLSDIGQLQIYDFSGTKSIERHFGRQWVQLDARHNAYFLWNWNSGVLQLDYDGKPVREIPLPLPLRQLRLIPKQKEFIVVHDQLTIARYDENGNNIWTVNNPALIELSDQISSEIEVSDSGKHLAISCFDRGVFVYSDAESIRNIELEFPVSHTALSRNGRRLILADSQGGLFLVDLDGNIIWNHTLQTETHFCRLNQTGSRALIMDKGGLLSCFEFYEGFEGRSDFLELDNVDSVLEKKAIWKKPLLKDEKPFGGVLMISQNGNCILFGKSNHYQAYDSQGALLWEKSFLVPYSDTYITQDGKSIFLRNADEVFMVDLATGREFFKTFYGGALREAAFDPLAHGFIVYDNNNIISFFSHSGKRTWKLTLKNKVSKLRLDCNSGIALFKGVNNVLFAINLKNHQIEKISIDEIITNTCVHDSTIYLTCESGIIYALDVSGKIKWRSRTNKQALKIIPFKNTLAVIGEEGYTSIYNHEGSFIAEAQIHNSKSILNDSSEETIEIVPEKSSISCYKLLSGELMWRIQTRSPDYLVSVSAYADRMVLLNQDSMQYHYLVKRPDISSERANYLEF